MKSAATTISFLAALALSSLCTSCSAFAVVGHSPRRATIVGGFRLLAAQQTPEPEEPMAPAAADNSSEERAAFAEESTSATMDDNTPAEGTPVEVSAEQEEVAALKTEISDLEFTLKSLRSNLAWTTDKADDFSKAGYARKVAELESMRRSSKLRQTSSRTASIAAVLAEFLPMRDQLEQLKATYGDDEFGKQYNAIPTAMAKAFNELGVTEYTMAVGEPIKNIINESRCIVVDGEYSDQVPKDTVLRPLRMGLELQGNIVRPAECIASLGSEQAEAEQEPQQEASSEGENGEEVSNSAEEAA